MELSTKVQQSIRESVLCWLATYGADGFPNVTPKEAFMYDPSGHLLIANIASPGSVGNIRLHPNVCASFINVLTQKGYKIKGTAQILEHPDPGFQTARQLLQKLIGTRFEIISIIQITPKQVDPILAPSYRLFKDTTEETMVADSLKTYRVHQYSKTISQPES